MRRITLSLACLLAAAPSVAAQPSDQKALAEQLFNQGRDLTKAGNWEAACPKFEASLRYDATLGTRLNLANCYEKVGKLASAWGLYRDAAEIAAKAGDKKRQDYAVAQAKALEARLPKLTITAPAKSPPGLTVTRDGAPVDAAVLGTSFYIDPGDHVITASAPGFKPFKTTIRTRETTAETVELPALEPLPAPVEPKPVEPDDTEDDGEPEEEVAPPPRTRKFVGIGMLGAGVVAAGVGVVFGVKAGATYDDAKQLCGPALECIDANYDRGAQLVADSRSQAMLSTIFVIAGGAVAVTGVVLWVTAPSAGRAVETARLLPVVTDRSVALVLGGSF